MGSVTPYTLVMKNGAVSWFRLSNNKHLDKVRKLNGVVFEDWETAKKVAFLNDADSGLAGTVLYKKIGCLFIPHELPNWAVLI
jgi:hypothetical protein